MPHLDIAFSPCPNDTFIFHAMLQGYIDTGSFRFTPHLDDVQTLNNLAFSRTYPVTKLSFYTYLLLKDRYALLDAGAALGHGCGPLLVAGSDLPPIADARVVVPGRYTTAHLLLKLWRPDIAHVETASFDAILPGIRAGRWDAGVIIHEGRFIYPRYGLTEIVDLGRWWEEKTRLPIPLGCIAVRKDGDAIAHKQSLESLIRDSLAYGQKHPQASRAFVKQHARELDDSVIEEHIKLYVNSYTMTLGAAGKAAVDKLEQTAQCSSVL
ncbi:MAG TPA: 1,4-dihydroxy-6-naphthoate synthase [Desulfosalsimonadaceae bacterium]|nr:1,4-dihydroxy-6-naphthoate synthase [Desulfosalsimonadaceae bacterium]